MRGSVRKRCQCRDAEGRRVKQCRKAHGSWSYVIDVGSDPTTAKRRQISRAGFRTRDQAEEEMVKELAAIDSGLQTNDRETTLGEWLDEWLEGLVERDRSPKTLASYRSHIVNFWRPRLGHVRLRDLRRAHVDAALRDLGKAQGGERGGGNSGSHVERRSPATVDSYRRTLRAALSRAVARDLIRLNPAEGRLDAIPDRAKHDDESDLPIWEPHQTAHFLEHVAGDRLAALYELAAYGGLRRAELCGLRWSDIDADEAGITIRQTIVELTRAQAGPGDLRCPVCGAEHVGRHFKRPKSRKARRWIPLAAPAREALHGHRAAQEQERAEFGTTYRDHDLVFCAVDGDPIRPDALTREFKALARDCGLPPIRLHDMRHGACSLMLSGGVPIEVVQMIMGHSSQAVTRRVYAHLIRKATSQQFEAAMQALTDHRATTRT